jgi:hypothetical protein
MCHNTTQHSLAVGTKEKKPKRATAHYSRMYSMVLFKTDPSIISVFLEH